MKYQNFLNIFLMVLRNAPRKIALQENCPPENYLPEKLSPGKLPTMKFFYDFFLISVIFMRIFVRKWKLFSFDSFFWL